MFAQTVTVIISCSVLNSDRVRTWGTPAIPRSRARTVRGGPSLGPSRPWIDRCGDQTARVPAVVPSTGAMMSHPVMPIRELSPPPIVGTCCKMCLY